MSAPPKPWLMLVYLAATTALVYGLFSGWAYDDPYITYRYADNLARGLGPVYNPGERVLSTTTPLFALLLGGLSPLWGDLPHLANLIGAFSLALGGLCLWDLGRCWDAPSAGWTGLLLYPTFPLLITTLGSETPLYLACCLGAFALYARGRHGWAAASAALALLARPDGALVVVLLGLDTVLRNRDRGFRSLPWRAIGVYLLLALPWFIFAWSYYGSPLPVTLAAKQQQGAMAVSQRFAAGFLTIVRSYAAYPQYWLEALLALAGLVYLWRAARRWGLLLAWTALYFAAYTILGVSRYYWYYAPLVPGFIALVGLGISGLARALRQPAHPATPAATGSTAKVGANAAPGVIAAGVLTIGVATALALAQVANLLQLRQNPDRRAPIYAQVGRWLAENTAPDDPVGALEVGIIGYYARRPMVDFAGLIQPEVAARLSAGSYEDAALWAVERYRPAYLALKSGDFPRLESGYVAAHCRPAARFAGEPFGYDGELAVYACRRTW